MQYISLTVRKQHFKDMNRTLFNALVVLLNSAAILAGLLSGPASVANAEANLTTVDRYWMYHNWYMKHNPKTKGWIK